MNRDSGKDETAQPRRGDARVRWLPRLVPVLLLGLFAAGVVSSQEPSQEGGRGDDSATSQEQEIEQIAVFLLDLEVQKRKLLEVLSPAAREKVLRRLAVLEEQQAGAGLASAGTQPVEMASEEVEHPSRDGRSLAEPEAVSDVLVMPTRIAESAPSVASPDGPSSVERSESAVEMSEDAVEMPKRLATDPVAKPAKDRLSTARDGRCAAWTFFDTNGDGDLSGADRYWRHFPVWMDDGDGVPQEEEMKDSFALGLRKLSLDLRSYEGAKQTSGVVERRLHSGRERLRVEILKRSRGSSGADYGFLAIDIAGLVRGGGPRVRRFDAEHPEGEILTAGFVLVEQGVEIEVVGEAVSEMPEDAEGSIESNARGVHWLPLLCARTVR